jgi:predicted nuclease of predicted toxin-antitoxin system
LRELDPGFDDTRVLALANELDSLLLTSDKDFGELAFRQRLVHAGVVLFRLVGLSIERKAEILVAVLRAREKELIGAFTAVAPTSVRIRSPRSMG